MQKIPRRVRATTVLISANTRPAPRELDARDPEPRVRGKYQLRVELALGPAPAGHQPAGAVAEDVAARVGDRHAPTLGHLRRRSGAGMRSLEWTPATTASRRCPRSRAARASSSTGEPPALRSDSR